MFLASPSNPQGAVADRAYLEKLTALARRFGLRFIRPLVWGALAYTFTRAREESRQAVAALGRVPGSVFKDALVELATFANGEKYCRLGENVRGSDVFVLQGHCDPINDHVMEQLIMIDALKRASAARITACCISSAATPA